MNLDGPRFGASGRQRRGRVHEFCPRTGNDALPGNEAVSPTKSATTVILLWMPPSHVQIASLHVWS